MTEAELIDGILQREGGYVDDPADKGGATQFGITAMAWGLYSGYGRQATRAEVQTITREQAVEFYRRRYCVNSPFAVVPYEPLRVQCIDSSVLSGNARTIRWLQRVLDVEPTSVLDDRTKAALVRDRGPLVNRAMVAARVTMMERMVADDPSQAKFREGWIARAVSFGEFSA